MNNQIKKDIEKIYGDDFIKNYSLFKQGEICFSAGNGAPITYVYEGAVMRYTGEVIYPEKEKNDVQVFFDHSPDVYRTFNVTKEVDSILGKMLDGKDWKSSTSQTYRYRDGKFWEVIPSYVWSGWISELEISKKEMIVRIISQKDFLPASTLEEVEKEERKEENVMENSTVILKRSDFPPLPPVKIKKV
jgi:hypothetical protein